MSQWGLLFSCFMILQSVIQIVKNSSALARQCSGCSICPNDITYNRATSCVLLAYKFNKISWAKIQKQVWWFRWFCPPVHSMHTRPERRVRKHIAPFPQFTSQTMSVLLSWVWAQYWNIGTFQTPWPLSTSSDFMWICLLCQTWIQGVSP